MYLKKIHRWLGFRLPSSSRMCCYFVALVIKKEILPRATNKFSASEISQHIWNKKTPRINNYITHPGIPVEHSLLMFISCTGTEENAASLPQLIKNQSIYLLVLKSELLTSMVFHKSDRQKYDCISPYRPATCYSLSL